MKIRRKNTVSFICFKAVTFAPYARMSQVPHHSVCEQLSENALEEPDETWLSFQGTTWFSLSRLLLPCLALQVNHPLWASPLRSTSLYTPPFPRQSAEKVRFQRCIALYSQSPQSASSPCYARPHYGRHISRNARALRFWTLSHLSDC